MKNFVQPQIQDYRRSKIIVDPGLL